MIPQISTRYLAGRVALVTGGSRGIGRAICLRLAAHGAKVAIHYREREKEARAVEAAISASGSSALSVRKKLDGEPACRELIAEVAGGLGPIDILVNNAGIFTGAAIEDLDSAMWNETLTLNLSVPFHCIRACLPAMRKRGWGRIISISSQAGLLGSAGHAHYAAAKAGLLGLTFSLVRELGASGITANVVSPGRVETEMIADHLKTRRKEWLSQTPLGRFGRAEEIAATVAFLCSDDAGFVTGANLNINGGTAMG
ncbi:MAG: SDR family oxidoreductase [Opitutaceae bacterium]|jgi:NAD(P)-dependent dehydrogenase (short-subunit alcohol dehydrogenase family)